MKQIIECVPNFSEGSKLLTEGDDNLKNKSPFFASPFMKFAASDRTGMVNYEFL